MKKRGQVTLFVIVGLVLLIVALLLIFLNSKKIENQPNLVDKYSETISNDMSPLKNDVEFCLAKTGKDAFKKLGLHGGFIDVPPFVQYNLTPEYMDTGVEMFPGSGIVLPYWSYISSKPDCTSCRFGDNSPPLEGPGQYSIQTQVQNYIDANILTCLNNLSDYKERYNVTYDTPKSLVAFDDHDVFLGLDWNISMGIDNTWVSATKFNTILDLQFKRLYNLAKSLLFQTEQLSDKRMGEELTRSVVTTLSVNGQNAIIPPADGPVVEGLQNMKTWNLQDTRKILKDFISQNINYLQVEGSKDSYKLFTNDPYKQALYSKFQIPYVSNDDYYQQVKIRYNFFPSWPIYLRTNPGYGDFAMPNMISKNILFLTFSIADYKFSYDITHPIMTSIEDNTAFKGDGYTFQYAYEVNIRNNKPYTNDTIFVNSSLYESNKSSIFSDNDQRTVPMKITTINGYNDAPLEGVQLSYFCADEGIIAGLSVLKDGSAQIDTKLPPCIGGYFSILNSDMTADRLYADISDGLKNQYTMKVYPEKTFDFRIKKRLFLPQKTRADLDIKNMDRDWRLNTAQVAAVPPLENEQLIVSFTRMDKGDTQTNYVRTVIVNGTNDANITITPGKYSVMVMAYLPIENGSNITIPKITFSPSIVEKALGAKDVVIPAVVFNSSLITGMLILDNNTRYMNLDSSAMVKNTTMTMYYSGLDPKYLETGLATDLKVYDSFRTSSVDYPALFNPEFS